MDEALVGEPPRIVPELDDLNRGFWTSGADGVLRVQRCQQCRSWSHPPLSVCRRCRSTNLADEDTSGRGTVYSFAVNHQPWNPGLRVPYVVALVVLDGIDDFRLTTNIVGVDPAGVHIGMRVDVTFLHQDDIYIPLFRPARE